MSVQVFLKFLRMGYMLVNASMISDLSLAPGGRERGSTDDLNSTVSKTCL